MVEKWGTSRKLKGQLHDFLPHTVRYWASVVLLSQALGQNPALKSVREGLPTDNSSSDQFIEMSNKADNNEVLRQWLNVKGWFSKAAWCKRMLCVLNPPHLNFLLGWSDPAYSTAFPTPWQATNQKKKKKTFLCSVTPESSLFLSPSVLLRQLKMWYWELVGSDVATF